MAPESLDVDALYAAPPARFVEERKRLGRALRAAGRREEALAVEKLARPTVSVWATNQLARREPARVGELLALTDRLRDTQGRGDAGAFGEAASAHRAILAALRADAQRILAEGGHPTSPQLLGRIVGNLRAAADPALRAKIEAGRLEKDVEETDFLGLLEGSLAEAPVVSRPAPSRPEHAARAARPAPEAATKKAEAQRRRAEEAAARAAERARAAGRARAVKQAHELRGEIASARLEIDRALRSVSEAREALAASERRLEAARARESALSQSLAEVEATLADP